MIQRGGKNKAGIIAGSVIAVVIVIALIIFWNDFLFEEKEWKPWN